MKAAPLLVAWHNEKAPIYSAQFDPHGNGRLATGGGDNNIRLWRIEGADDERRVTYLSTLVKHTQAINVVRWCPRGELLASAGDDGNILLWAPSDLHHSAFGEDDADDKEKWTVKRMCRSSSGSEIYDLAWSPDGNFFITGSMDNVARIFDAQSGNIVRQIADHTHYVQGVAWDPLNEFIATQSSDRSVHIYKLKSNDGQAALYSKMTKMDLPSRRPSSNSPAPPDFGHRSMLQSVENPNPTSNPTGSPVPSAPGTPTSLPLPMNPPPPTSSHSRRTSRGNSSPSLRRSPSPAPSLPLPAVMPSPSPNPKNTTLYANETLTSFFRRLTFAPDGSLLFTPAGQYKTTTHAVNGDPSRTVEDVINTVYIYSRGGLNKPPIGHLPGHKKPSVAVRCSPVFYNLRLPTTTKQITIDTSSSGDDIAPLPDPVIPTKGGSSSMDPPSTAGPRSPTASNKAASPTSRDSPLPDGPPPAFALPYRIVYAVATQDAVYVYDTQQQTPLCVVSNLHFATFTDLSWSNDGNTLLITSSDGFCSYLSFASGELGTTYHGSLSTRTQHHPSIINTSTPGPTPGPTPTTTTAPVQIKHPSSAGFAPSPSPAVAGPMSPTRSNSASSITTQSSFVVSNPAPSMTALPGVAAAPGGVHGPAPHHSPTPPMTPASTSQVVANPPASSNVLGKRNSDSDTAAAGADSQETKKRRVAPTLVSKGVE